MSEKLPFQRIARGRYFEDYEVGAVFEFGETIVTEASVLSFAEEYDPQAFHVDPEAARHGPFGGLIASGWHTISLLWRMVAENFLSKVAALGSPGVERISWPTPTRPGDILSTRVTILAKKASQSRPERGFVTIQVEGINQDGKVVAKLEGVILMVATAHGQS